VGVYYHLGIKLFEWGCIVQEQMEIRSYAFPIMKELAEKTEESVDLNIILDRKRVSIEKIESFHDIRRVIELGKSLPLYTGGSGKVLFHLKKPPSLKVVMVKGFYHKNRYIC